MRKEILNVVNKMTDDDAANSAYVIKEDNNTKLLLMTNTGIMIIDLKSDAEIVSMSDKDLSHNKDMEFGFALSVKKGDKTEYIYIDEDGEIEDGTYTNITLQNIEFAGNMDELAELVEDEAVPYEIYEWLDDWGVMLG